MKKINSNGQIFGGAADLFNSVENFLYGNDYALGLHDWLNADYVAEIGTGSCLVTGWDHILGDYRLFIESPNSGENTTGKYCLVLYSVVGGFHEVRRQIIGGANRVGSWAKVAELAIEWLEDILLPLKDKLESDLMFEYAAEAAEEIEMLASQVTDKYEDIVREMESDDPDLENVEYMVDDMYRILVDIENELSGCLHRCDDRTGCDIGWDDFCTADYFEPIKIMGTVAPYSIAEFINFYNTDAAEFMDSLIANIWRSLEGEKQIAFRDLVNDMDMPFMIAA